MSCPTCGAGVDMHAATCPGCGARLSAASSPRPGKLRKPLLLIMLATAGVSLAGLCLLGAAVFVLAALLDEPWFGLLALLCLVLAVVLAACGYGVWTLKPYGRTLLTVVACIGLPLFPFGTLLSALVLYYVRRPHVRILFSGKTPEQLSAEDARTLERSSDWGLLLGMALSGGALFWVSLFAAIAIPSFLNAVDRGKQKRTMADIETLAGAIEGYSVDHDSYPDATSLEEMLDAIVPDYIETAPTRDGWGRPFRVSSSPTAYVIRSPGKDGVFEDQPGWGPQAAFDADIIFQNGEFAQWPEGAQR